MARAVQNQNTLNGGIYSPALAERDDTQAYYAALRDMLNVRPLAEGGVEARGGLVFCNLMRGPMAEIDLTSVTFTANEDAALGETGDTIPAPDGGVTDPPIYPGADRPPTEYDEILP